MKKKLLQIVTIVLLQFSSLIYFGQTYTLGSTSNYVLFSTNGPLSNTGVSSFTGDVGTNNGSCSNFVNVSGGTVHTMDASTALCATDLLSLYNQLNNSAATLIAVPTLGNNQVITAGVYSITTAASLNATLTLDAQNNPAAVFVIKVVGAFATNAGAVVNLINGAQACNVYWQVEGAITLGAGTLMKGTLIANNAAIGIGAGSILVGRALSTAGAVTVNSSTLSMAVCSYPSPTIITQPTSQTLCVGASASFSVVAIGAGLTYQWRNGLVNLINSAIISGATSSVLTINPASAADNSANYNVVVNGTYLPGVTSINAGLFVANAASLTAQPGNQTVCVGATAVFSIQASGTNLTYQWRKGLINLNNGGSVAGATSAILTINPVSLLDAAANYNCVITNLCAVTLTSNNSALIVNSSASITSQPSNLIQCEGTNASYSVTASGSALTYQWRKGLVNLTNGVNISGATTSVVTISSIAVSNAGTDYNVVVTGACLPSETSIQVSLVVNTSPNITTQPISQTVCAGGTTTFQINTTASTISYQWRKGTVSLINGGTVAGATSSVLTLSALNFTDAATNYNVVISGICSPTIASINVALAISAPPVILSSPASQTVCAGSPVNFIVVTTGTGLTYQWRKGVVPIVNGGLISGATTSVLTISSVSAADIATNYNVMVIGSCSPNQVSANAGLLVPVAPAITSSLLSQTVCAGASVSFSISATGTNLTYQWRKGLTNISNGNAITGANTPTLTINPTDATAIASNYNVVVSGFCLPDQISNSASLALTPSPKLISQQASQSACVGDIATFSVSATGTNLTYQWRKGSTILTNSTNYSGVTTATLIINPLDISDTHSNYNVIISGGCAPSITSSPMAITVKTSPLLTLQPNNQMAYVNGGATFMVQATGENLSYQWRKGTVNLTNGTKFSGVTTSVLNISNVQMADTASNYNVVISGTCLPPVTSNNAILWVCFCANPTALREELESEELLVYPNPFTTAVNVEISQTSTLSLYEFTLYNGSGMEVLQAIITKDAHMVDVSSLPSGLYTYKITSENKVIKSGKLISQH